MSGRDDIDVRICVVIIMFVVTDCVIVLSIRMATWQFTGQPCMVT